MNRTRGLAATLVAAWSSAAIADGVAGHRDFPPTLVIDDPEVEDDMSLPTLSTFRNATGPETGAPGNRQYNAGFEWNKRLTKDLGLSISTNYIRLLQNGGGSLNGWQNLNLFAKYQAYVNPDHEFLLSLGVIREIGGTGTRQVGAEPFGATTPTIYYGKGLGDLAIGVFRPLVITGTFGHQFTDKPNVSPNLWAMGWSIQYSIPYLRQYVVDLDLPEPLAGLTPLVEINLTTPSWGAGGEPTRASIAPGVLYRGDSWQFGIEALLPLTRGTHATGGVIAQLHFFLDDLFPKSLGKPIFSED